MTLECKHCGHPINTGKLPPGHWVTCPKCRRNSTIPETAGGEPAAPPPAEAPAPAPKASRPAAWRPPPEKYVSPAGPATLLMLFLIVRLIVSAGGIWANAHRLSLDPTDVSIVPEAAFLPLHVITFLLAFAMFLVWEHRAYRNLIPLGFARPRFTPGETVAWYFCPILNLWKPCQAMVDIWRGSASAGGRGPAAPVIWWWFFFVLGWGLSHPLPHGRHKDLPPEALKAATSAECWIQLGELALGIVAIVLTMWLVVQVNRRQARRHAGQRSAP